MFTCRVKPHLQVNYAIWLAFFFFLSLFQTKKNKYWLGWAFISQTKTTHIGFNRSNTINLFVSQSKRYCEDTYSCAANSRLILATCSLSSMSLSPWSPLSFLLVGLMGGGPVLWLEMEDKDEEDDDEEEDEDRDKDCSLGSTLNAASPEGKRKKHLLEVPVRISREVKLNW